jgi:hypothetical protein
MLQEQKELLKENIIAPVLGSIFEKCREKSVAQQLIDEAKLGQLGRKRFEAIFGSYNLEMLDALNGISRFYENPRQILLRTYGTKTPSDSEIITAANEIIRSLMNTYYPSVGSVNKHSAQGVMDTLRKDVVLYADMMRNIYNYKKGKFDEGRYNVIVKEIMNLKERAGILNSGELDYRSKLNLSNLDLSNLDLSKGCFKAMSFINSNLSNTKFRSVDSAVFDGCNLENADFENASMIGEQVSFKNANVRNTKFTGVRIEKSPWWTKCANPAEIKEEVKKRGAANVDEAIFTLQQNHASILAREWSARTQSTTSTQTVSIPSATVETKPQLKEPSTQARPSRKGCTMI